MVNSFPINAEIITKTNTEGFFPKLTIYNISDRVLRGSVEETLEAGKIISLPYSLSLWVAKYRSSPLQLDLSKKRKKQRLVVPAYATCLPASAATLPVACLSPALESEQSRTSIDESGNRHREVLSKS